MVITLQWVIWMAVLVGALVGILWLNRGKQSRCVYCGKGIGRRAGLVRADHCHHCGRQQPV